MEIGNDGPDAMFIALSGRVVSALKMQLTPKQPILEAALLKAILTDRQFWIPVAVLALGIALLACLR
jgi:hypothetical protein